MLKRLTCKHNNITYLSSEVIKTKDNKFFVTKDIYRCNRCKKIIKKSI